MFAGLIALLLAVVATVLIGGHLRRRDGRIRRATPSPEPPPVAATRSPEARAPAGDPPAGDPSDGLPGAVGAAVRSVPAGGVLLLQLSTTFCAPCRHARVVLTDLTGRTPGLTYADLDLTDHPDLPGRLRVRSTPTVLALDPAGRELLRVTGVPRPAALLDALRPHLAAAATGPTAATGSTGS